MNDGEIKGGVVLSDTDKPIDAKTMLAQVNEAIMTVLVGGQSYRLGSRSLTRADLAMLRSMRSELEAQVGNGQDDALLGGTYVALFEGR